MNQEIDRKNIERSFEQICQHKLFVGSPTYKRLLEYLIEKSLAHEDLKEYTVGTDLYGIDYAEDKSNGTVRSYMYKLRKKLESYYDETSFSDPLVFIIEKGQYNLRFCIPEEVKKTINSAKHLNVPLKPLMSVALLLVVALVAFLIIKSLPPKFNAPWDSYFQKGGSNLVVVSDHFTINEIDSSDRPYVRIKEEINSHIDFEAYVAKHPDEKLETTDYTLMSKMAPFSIKILTEWFLQHKSNYNLELESQLEFDDVKRNNILFVGQFKSMNISRTLFLKTSKVFSVYEDGFKFASGKTEKIFNTKHDPMGKVEFAMVSFTSFSPGKKALYFVSNNDIGVMATLRNFTDNAWLKEFYKQIPSKTNHFNALFKVSGIQRTDVSCELVELEIME